MSAAAQFCSQIDRIPWVLPMGMTQIIRRKNREFISVAPFSQVATTKSHAWALVVSLE